MNIGTIIENYQREHLMSEREFAKKCGLSHTHINSLKKGITSAGKKFTPTVDTLRKVAAAMGISLQTLMMEVEDLEIKWEEKDTVIPPAKMELINRVLTMDDIQLDRLARLLDIVEGK